MIPSSLSRLSLLLAAILFTPAVADGGAVREDAVVLSLEEALETALRSNLEVANAVIETAKSEKDKDSVDRERLPEVSLGTNYTRLSVPEVSDIPIPGFTLPDADADLALKAEMPLYTGGRLPAARRQAALGLDLTREAERGVRDDILLETATSFYELLAAQKFLEIAEEALGSSNSHLVNVKILLGQGQVAKVDLYRTELDVAERESDLAAAEANVIRRAERLSSLLFPDRIVDVRARWEVPEPEELEPVTEWMAIAERLSPELDTARLAVDLAQAGVMAGKAELWPTMGLFGTYGSKDEHFSFAGEDRYWNAGVALSLPLFRGGRNLLAIEKAHDEEQQASNSLIQAHRSVRRAMVDAHADTTLALRQHAAAAKAIVAAEENLRVTQLKYQQGLIANTDVIDALLSLSRARFDIVQTTKNYFAGRARLMRLAGSIEELL